MSRTQGGTMMDVKSTTIADYIQHAPTQAQAQLKELHAVISAMVPQAEEAISYGIPTFKLYGNMIHFGGYKKHIALYPGAAPIAEFADELKTYNTAKGTIQFPIGTPLPIALIKRIVKSCQQRQLAKGKK